MAIEKSVATLPDLPYDYGALAPHIAGEIMELHHSKHHQTYVNGLNSVLDQLAESRANGSFGTTGGLEKTLAVFWPSRTGNLGRRHGGGHRPGRATLPS